MWPAAKVPCFSPSPRHPLSPSEKGGDLSQVLVSHAGMSSLRSCATKVLASCSALWFGALLLVLVVQDPVWFPVALLSISVSGIPSLPAACPSWQLLMAAEYDGLGFSVNTIVLGSGRKKRGVA